jgi:hypothetical protein
MVGRQLAAILRGGAVYSVKAARRQRSHDLARIIARKRRARTSRQALRGQYATDIFLFRRSTVPTDRSYPTRHCYHRKRLPNARSQIWMKSSARRVSTSLTELYKMQLSRSFCHSPGRRALDSERADSLPRKTGTQFANAARSAPASRELLLPLLSFR